jgi:hypothetical protein
VIVGNAAIDTNWVAPTGITSVARGKKGSELTYDPMLPSCCWWSLYRHPMYSMAKLSRGC